MTRAEMTQNRPRNESNLMSHNCTVPESVTDTEQVAEPCTWRL